MTTVLCQIKFLRRVDISLPDGEADRDDMRGAATSVSNTLLTTSCVSWPMFFPSTVRSNGFSSDAAIFLTWICTLVMIFFIESIVCCCPTGECLNEIDYD